MIPKKIHYCWFGRNPLPNDAQKCINSWKNFFPGYEIVEWNEDNFNVNSIPYIADAYKAKKYAFVSDYARFKILYDYGGIYFDTDVEVIKSFSDILSHGGFMGYESPGLVNPGLGLAIEKGNPIYRKILNHYESLDSFVLQESNCSIVTVVHHTTNVLKKAGIEIDGDKITQGYGFMIYPVEWFNPLDSVTGRMHITSNTHSIHLYSKSWLKQSKLRKYISMWVHRMVGVKSLSGVLSSIRTVLSRVH